ncbi:hypothetical protein D3C86_2139910 [compost metagenome]
MAKTHHLIATKVVDQTLVDLPTDPGLFQAVCIGGPSPSFARRPDVIASVVLVVEYSDLHFFAIDGAPAVGAVCARKIE